MHIPDHPKMIRFGEKECCALRLALENHFEKISEFLETMIPGKRLALYRDILIEPKNYGGAVSLGFIPNEEHKIFYGLAAETELARLNGEKQTLPCGCEKKEHIEALKKAKSILG